MSVDPLISASLLGTSRSSALPPAPNPALKSTWETIPAEPPAEALLGALALARSYSLAGRRTTKAAHAEDPASREERPEFPDHAVAALLRMLGGDYKEVMPEWLVHAGQSGQIMPARVLPELLEAGCRDASVRPALAELAGKRGRWLAKRHARFGWLLDGGSSDEGTWDDDHAAERLEWWRRTRRENPETAISALTESWAGESPDFREALVCAASAEPMAEDEKWLESLALRERRQAIRRFAAVALMQLPASGFAKRAEERVKSLVRLEKKLLKRRIVIEPPHAFDPAWAADDLVEKAPARTGQKAWWLRQLVAAVPVSAWPRMLGVEAGELFALSMDADWRDAVIAGWIDAACAVPHEALAQGLLPFLAKMDPWPTGAVFRTTALATILDGTGESELLVKKLPEPEVLDLLIRRKSGTAPPGSTALTVVRKVLKRSPATLTRPEARRLAMCIPLPAIQAELEALARLPELTAPAEEFAATLEFRRTLFLDPDNPS